MDNTRWIVIRSVRPQPDRAWPELKSDTTSERRPLRPFVIPRRLRALAHVAALLPGDDPVRVGRPGQLVHAAFERLRIRRRRSALAEPDARLVAEQRAGGDEPVLDTRIAAVEDDCRVLLAVEICVGEPAHV